MLVWHNVMTEGAAFASFKILVNFDPPHLTKIRVVLASILPKNFALSPTTASSLSASSIFKAGEKPPGKVGRVMFFLLRMAFWLTVVCVLLPGGGTKSTSPEAQIDATQAASLAGAAVSDVRGFCDRQPDACVVGGKVAIAIGHKAEAGARTIYEFITAKMNEKSTPADRATARLAPASTGNQSAGNGTLTSGDMAPNWHAPVPLPPRREARASRPSA
jgi:hypothetical protein